MFAESHQREVPADANGAGAVLFPEVLGHVRDVFELELGALGGAGRQAYVHPAGLPAEFPCDAERFRRLALCDGAPRVAFELIASAWFQIAGYRQKPARNALGVGERVPQIVGSRVVGTLRDDHFGGLAFVFTIIDDAGDRADHSPQIHVVDLLFGRDRASIHLYKSTLIYSRAARRSKRAAQARSGAPRALTTVVRALRSWVRPFSPTSATK